MRSSNGISEKQSTRREHILNAQEVDVAAALDLDESLNPDVAARIRYVRPNYDIASMIDDRDVPRRRKIDWHLMPLMCSTQPSFIWEINMFSTFFDSHVSVSWKTHVYICYFTQRPSGQDDIRRQDNAWAVRRSWDLVSYFSLLVSGSFLITVIPGQTHI